MGRLESIVEAFWTAFEQGRLDAVFVEHMTADCEFVMPGAPAMRGPEQLRPLFAAYAGAFPDMRHHTLHAIESADTYSAETRYTGTHRGALQGAKGTIPATGRSVEWCSADVIRFRGGKIASWHVYHDPAALLAQLGVPGGAS